MKLAVFTGAFFIASFTYAQSVLNGSFETTTAPSSCSYNISNATYNAQMSNSHAFGVYEAIDIVVSGCYIPTIADGTYAVAIANYPNNNLEGEAISLELSAPLVIGQGYEISFQAYANTDFGPQGDLIIGVSTSNNTFGTAVDTASTIVGSWTSFTFNFVATTAATHITAMQVPGISSWNFVDDFSIATTCSPTTGVDLVSACESYTWIDGNTYTTSNNSATDTLMNAAGCDSIVTLDLTINTSSTGTDTQSACNSYTWIDGNTYTSDNNTATYTIIGGAANGCDSIVTLDLTIDNVSDITVTAAETTIMANNTNATYQWIDCETGNAIPGETGQSFTATSNGSYAVILTENGCVDTSACESVTTVGIIESNFPSEINLFPNPTNGVFTIDLGESYSLVEMTLTDTKGKVISSKVYMDTDFIEQEIDEPIGLYFVTVRSHESQAVLRVIKE